ncbi:DUF1415 domain-containing protein [Kiloniella antarctica]|uniref:DUF1415 domain-containing protein n=1 Tax=Kiloniella antarctica TaxID=1550907 RepID=A0ABW5BNY6_9PROT
MKQLYPPYKIENAQELTRLWVENMVAGFNLCPFAAPEINRDSVRYAIVTQSSMEEAVRGFLEEILLIQENLEEKISTTLVIFPIGWEDFEDFIELLMLAEDCMEQSGLEGLFQLASFHPHYCFDGVEVKDISNWTNRAPFPVLHIIREGQMSRVLSSYKKAEEIPERNIELMKNLGREGLIERFPPFADYINMYQ